MKCKQIVFNVIGATIFAALLAGSSAMASAMPPQDVETGFLVSLRGNSLAISNVAMGGGGSGAGQPQMRMMTRGSDGQTRELTGEELEKAKQRMRAGGGASVSVNVDSSGKKTYSTMGPDGKIRRLTEEEYKEMQKKMSTQGGDGGHTIRMRTTEGGPTADGANTKPRGERKKVSFTKFEITDETEMPENIERGTQIKVHYRIEGDRKIATKVEAVI